MLLKKVAVGRLARRADSEGTSLALGLPWSGAREPVCDTIRVPGSWDPVKGTLAVRPVAVDKKVGVESEGIRDPKPFHYREGRTVYEAKQLIREGLHDPPCGFQVYRLHRYDRNLCVPKPLPKSRSRGPTKVSMNESPRFGQDQIGCDK